jgi:hypothetical protein
LGADDTLNALGCASPPQSRPSGFVQKALGGPSLSRLSSLPTIIVAKRHIPAVLRNGVGAVLCSSSTWE